MNETTHFDQFCAIQTISNLDRIHQILQNPFVHSLYSPRIDFVVDYYVSLWARTGSFGNQNDSKLAAKFFFQLAHDVNVDPLKLFPQAKRYPNDQTWPSCLGSLRIPWPREIERS